VSILIVSVAVKTSLVCENCGISIFQNLLLFILKIFLLFFLLLLEILLFSHSTFFSCLLYVAVVLSTSITVQMTDHSSHDAMACDRSFRLLNVDRVMKQGFDVAQCERDQKVKRFQTVRKTEQDH